jgi:hypothetical protein
VNTSLDAATYDDETRWARLKHDWYVSGRPYRDLSIANEDVRFS